MSSLSETVYKLWWSKTPPAAIAVIRDAEVSVSGGNEGIRHKGSDTISNTGSGSDHSHGDYQILLGGSSAFDKTPPPPPTHTHTRREKGENRCVRVRAYPLTCVCEREKERERVCVCVLGNPEMWKAIIKNKLHTLEQIMHENEIEMKRAEKKKKTPRTNT